MANMSLVKNPMPQQDPNVRNKNFQEVALGYTKEQAIDEAQRCLNCKKKPCVTGCPVQIDIPAFIEQVAKGEFEEAYKIITKSSSLPAVCGRVCPQESQCESTDGPGNGMADTLHDPLGGVPFRLFRCLSVSGAY